MQYKTKKCPHCKHTYKFFDADYIGYGSPVRTCESCGKNFIDKDYIEIAIDGIRKVDKKRCSPSTLIGAILFCGIFVFTLSGNSLSTSDGPPGMDEIIFFGLLAAGSLYLLISEIRGFKERQRFLAEETIASENRLKNREYAYFLKELGYYVPEKYLNKTTIIQPQTNRMEQPGGIDQNPKEAEQKNNILFCNKCGSRLLPNSDFCSFCGNKIERL